MAEDVATTREALYERITDAVRTYQRAVDVMDEIACVIMGINRTDARALDLLQQHGEAMTAGRLAAETGMTTGGVTAVVDRLEKAGYVRRKSDPSDRRRVLVEATEKAAEAAMAIYGPLGEGRKHLAKYSDHELNAMIDFLEIATEVTDKQVARLREGR